MGRTIRVQPVPESQKGPGKNWQVKVSGRIAERVGLKEGALDKAFGISQQTSGPDTLVIEDRNGRVVERKKINRDPPSREPGFGPALKAAGNKLRKTFF